MDFKAAITNSGEEKLYKVLSSEVERRLPSAAIEWKRSYGRPSKQVVLQANFLKFDPQQLSNSLDSATSLGSKPLLHIFWTSCLDNDTYKSKVRNHLLRWQKQLQDTATSDWLIVHVMYQENSKSGKPKPKIQLPRTSVYDKIKTEFGQKSQERCLQLWEPDKETLFTKSGESWESLLTQLRNLLLQSFGQQLDSFEDRIRVMRERYANPDWPFLSYFTVHEELALIYQSIMLKEDALVQYDEVDALLSQFIINSSGKDLPIWLEMFCRAPSGCDGVTLYKSATEHYRNLIKSEEISLLEFRNYLFARQCKLLIKNKKKWEIPSRLLEFLHSVVHELKLLKIEISDINIACWVILTCLQCFQILESYESKDHIFNSTMAQLCDYVRQKVQYIGEVTGLYFNRVQTNKEIEISKTLQSGFGNFKVSSKKESVSIPPAKQLQVALESAEEYKKFYLDLTNKCLQILTDVKRSHFAMLVGIDLAKFYLQHGQYLDAEPLLEKAWSVYKQQKWQTLYTDVLMPLADCQLKHELFDRYLNSVTLLSCAQCLPYATRQHYTSEFLKLSKNETLNLPTVSTDPVLKILDLKIDLVKNKGHIGDNVTIILSLQNELTEDLPCAQMNILSRYCDLNNPRSFSDEPISPRKSIFDQTDYGMSVSLSSTEKPKETSTKEPLTPSNLLKRIKSHRRTWSKNRNVLNSESQELRPDSSSSSLSGSSPRNISPSQSLQSISSMTSKKTLFSMGDTEEEKLTNGDDGVKPLADRKTSLLDQSKSRSKTIENENESLTTSENALESNSNEFKLPAVPLASSSVSDNVTSKEQESKTVHTSTPLRNSNASLQEESSLFVEQEDDEILDRMLTSQPNLLLKPGKNEIKLCAKIINEGRFVLQWINCIVGNITLYKLLALSRDSRSFFMVADPPKITWTTDYLVDYLLTGSKQRLHVTLLNGPGVILDGSILEITSKSGLTFYSLTASSIQVFPLERDGVPREAAISIDVKESVGLLRLPFCKPYERVNIYMDVVAPVHRIAGESCMNQHEINFSCLWLKDLVDKPLRLDCIFYEPFQVKYETVYRHARTLVKVTLCGVNPVPLKFSSPQLVTVNNDSAFGMISGTTELRLFGTEECSLIWEYSDKEIKDCSELGCIFKVNFNTKDTDENDLGNFQQAFNISLQQCLYSVQVSMVTEQIQKSNACRVCVNITRKSCNQMLDYRLFLALNPDIVTWRYTGHENHTEVVFDDGKNEVKFEILLTTELTGLVAMPCLKLLRSFKMESMSDENNLDLYVQLAKGEVDYKTHGQMVTVNTTTVTDV